MMTTPKFDDLEASVSQEHLLTFELDRHTYALPLESIVQIIPMVTIIPIPQLNPLVQGVINVRGALVPVLDLQQHLKLPKTDLHLYTPILLASHRGQTVGLIVKDVNDIISIPTTVIVPPQDILPQELSISLLLQGLITTDKGPVIVLNVQDLFDKPQIELLEQATTLISEIDFSEEMAAVEEQAAEAQEMLPENPIDSAKKPESTEISETEDVPKE